MTELAQVSAGERTGGIAVARVEGEVDASNAARVGARLRALLSNQDHALAVDLTLTTYLDSAAIALLFALATELRQRQQRLLLVVAAGSPVGRVIALTGLDQAVPTHPALEEALAEVGESAPGRPQV